MSVTDRLPGATWLATQVERRSFLRKSANTLFYGAVATSAGALSLGTFLADPVGATGPCCPTSCCGPSPCCGTACCNKNCCNARGQCKGTGNRCGWDYRSYESACWSCGSTHGWRCCDCKTNSTTGCANTVNQCICAREF